MADSTVGGFFFMIEYKVFFLNQKFPCAHAVQGSDMNVEHTAC